LGKILLVLGLHRARRGSEFGLFLETVDLAKVSKWEALKIQEEA
jgi:hypothetical protein